MVPLGGSDKFEKRPRATLAGSPSWGVSVLISDLKVIRSIHILDPKQIVLHPCGARLRWRSPPPGTTWPVMTMNDIRCAGSHCLTVHLDSSAGTQYGHGHQHPNPNHQFCRAPIIHRNPAPLPPWWKQTSSPAAIIETPTT